MLLICVVAADVHEVAFDWISRLYYFADDGRELIFVCLNDLSKCRSVVNYDVSKPRGLALDSLNG